MASTMKRSPFARLERENERFDVRGKTGHPGNYDIKEIIFRYAGREGCFAYQIATGSKDIDNAYIEKGALYEPFTCWDWRDWLMYEGDERKRRLLWERQKGFKINGGEIKGGKSARYPSPTERWNQFRKRVNNENQWYVKRIAVAHWMEMKDIKWISEQLPALEALDLSDVQQGKGTSHLTDTKGRPRWSEILNTLRNSKPNLVDASAQPILGRLKWLGLSDCDDSKGEESPFSTILPECKQLETLSIRAPYEKRQNYDYRFDASMRNINREETHRKACSAILRISRNVPDTVTSIELRFYIDFLPHFLAQLEKFKSAIRRVGIDLGAWIQMYPLRKADCLEPITPSSPLHRDEMIKKNVYSAYCQAMDFSKTIDRAAVGSKPSAGALTTIKSGERSAAIHEKDLQDGALYRQNNIKFYQNDGGTYVYPQTSSTVDPGTPSCELGNHLAMGQAIKSQVVNSLPQLLMQLQLVARKSKIALYPLEPEPQNRSTSPVHPLALIQFEDEAECGAREDYLHDNRYQDLAGLYSWVNRTFKWRPVFDWDWFMVPEKMESTLDPAYNKIYIGKTDYMARIMQHFESLRAAGIPVHLLIGRRKIDTSSCYWGWPYDQQKWNEWLKNSFSANLQTIAGLVDTLSIFYDLRNPIDQARLEEIEAIKPHEWSTAPCPTVPCPWKGEGETICPFSKQRQPLRFQGTEDGKQKMANKRFLQQKKPQTVDYAQLANSYTSTPPVGESANDHESDDSDTEGSVPQESLHYLARRAAFTREAVGWQRFWAEYALKFKSLTTLRVRMPRCFDMVGSWRLANLLDQSKGWKLLFYTDERQHLHTEIDHFMNFGGFGAGVFEHAREAKVWPAGRFVRRSWVWPETQLCFRELEERHEVNIEASAEIYEKKRALEAYTEVSPEWGDSNLDIEGQEMIIQTEDSEKKELAEAVKQAVAAARHEQEVETALCSDIVALRQSVAQERLERKKLYHLGIRLFAQTCWFRGSSKLDFINGLHESLSNRAETKELVRYKAQIGWLRERAHEDIPIFGKPENDTFEGKDVLRNMDWVDAGSASPLDHTHFRKWAPAHWFEGLQVLGGVNGGVSPPKGASCLDTPTSESGTAKSAEKRKRTDSGKDDSPIAKKQRGDDVSATTDIEGRRSDTTVPEIAITTATTGNPTTTDLSRGKEVHKHTTTDMSAMKPAATKTPLSKTTPSKSMSPRATQVSTTEPASQSTSDPTALTPSKSTSSRTITEAVPEITTPQPKSTELTPKFTTEPRHGLSLHKAIPTPNPKPTITTEPTHITTIKPEKPPSPTSKPESEEKAAKQPNHGTTKKSPESNHVNQTSTEHNEEVQAPNNEEAYFHYTSNKKAKKRHSSASLNPDDDDNDEPPPVKKGRGTTTTTTTTTMKQKKKAERKRKTEPSKKIADPTSPVARRTRAAKAKRKKAGEEGKK